MLFKYVESHNLSIVARVALSQESNTIQNSRT